MTTNDLALIAETGAISHFDLAFGPVLRTQPSSTISERYKSRIPQENAALAVNLVEQAVDKMAERLIAAPTTDYSRLENVFALFSSELC